MSKTSTGGWPASPARIPQRSRDSEGNAPRLLLAEPDAMARLHVFNAYGCVQLLARGWQNFRAAFMPCATKRPQERHRGGAA